METTPEQLIAAYGMARHPEGGWYRELHRSREEVERCGDGKRRSALTVIAFLLESGDCSRWHRVRGADEVWHHAAGDPLDLWSLPPEGGEPQLRSLGPLDPGEPDRTPLRVIPAGWWQAARSRGAWTLVHCSVGPGFAFEDFDLMSDLPEPAQPQGALAELR